MHYRTSILSAVIFLSAVPAVLAMSSMEKISNPQVRVTEETLAPGETAPLPDKLPSMIVYMTAGVASINSHPESINPGKTVFRPVGAGGLKNTGSSKLRFVRVEFLTPGNSEIWGRSGLPPNYKIIIENKYVRAYDIKIPAQSREPQHTHHDRVVVSLSGAKLEHILPDGHIQPSTLKTGEVVWRHGGTHIGHNIGQTNLWVIAIEPK